MWSTNYTFDVEINDRPASNNYFTHTTTWDVKF